MTENDQRLYGTIIDTLDDNQILDLVLVMGVMPWYSGIPHSVYVSLKEFLADQGLDTTKYVVKASVDWEEVEAARPEDGSPWVTVEAADISVEVE